MRGHGQFVEQVKETVNTMLAQVHTCVPGKIVSFDPGTCQATVLPSMKIKKPDGEKMDYPQITGVPVVLIQCSNQNATVAYPIKAGDGCMIFFSEQALDQFLYERDTKTDLHFDLTNAVALVGIFSTANAVMRDACSQDAIIVDVGGTRLTIKNDGLIQADCKKFVINASESLTVNAGKVYLN